MRESGLARSLAGWKFTNSYTQVSKYQTIAENDPFSATTCWGSFFLGWLYLARTAGFRRRLVVDVSVVVVADIVARLSDFDCQDSPPPQNHAAIARSTTQFADSPNRNRSRAESRTETDSGAVFLLSTVALDRARSGRTDDLIDKSSPSSPKLLSRLKRAQNIGMALRNEGIAPRKSIESWTKSRPSKELI